LQNAKLVFTGLHIAVSKKQLHLYLSEACCHFNRRLLGKEVFIVCCFVLQKHYNER